jgi:hypothetical protein
MRHCLFLLQLLFICIYGNSQTTCSVNAGPDTTVCLGTPVQLNASVPGATGTQATNTYNLCLYDAGPDNGCSFSPGYWAICNDGYEIFGSSSNISKTFTTAPNQEPTSMKFKVYWTACGGGVITFNFYLNGNLVGTDTSSNSACTCDPVSQGTYPTTFDIDANAFSPYWNANGTNTFTVTTSGGNIFIAGATVTVIAGIPEFQWSPVTGLSDPNIANPLAAPTQTTVYTVLYTNADGCTATDTVVVTVKNDPPVAACKTLTVALNADRAASVNGILVNNGSYDNCGPVFSSIISGKVVYNCSDVGATYPVVLKVTDEQGNISTCTALVTVTDPDFHCNNPPVASCKAVTVFADNTGKGSAVAADFNNGSTDPEGGPLSFSVSPAGPYNFGTTNVTLTVTDDKNKSSTCTTTITVVDNTVPVPNVSVLPAITGVCSATATAPTATDNVSGAVTATTSNPVSYNTKGTHTITWTYNDGNGNVTTQTQQVIIDDNVAPVPNVSQLPSITAQCTASVTAPTATDNCKGTITGTTSSPVSYNTDGSYTITWIYNDGNGNTTTQQQLVVIDDNIAPVPDAAQLSPVTIGSVSALLAPTATDNCKGTITGTADLSQLTTSGTFQVTWTYNDGNGNSTTQVQEVTLNDVSPPVLTCPATQVLCYTGASYSIPALVATDNAGIAAVNYSITGVTTRSGTGNNASGAFNIGTSTISWTATDVNGYSSSCTTTVNIQPPLSVAIPDMYAVSPGGNVNTIYVGYGAQSLTLTAQPSGGTAPYTYLWSTGASSPSIAVGPSAEDTFSYSVTVTDSKGCVGSVTKDIIAFDVRCGNNNDKVQMCKVMGSNGNVVTLCVSPNAVAAHLATGAFFTCTIGRNPLDPSATLSTLEVYPNPATGVFKLRLKDLANGEARIQVMDNLGRMVSERVAIVGLRTQDIPMNLAKQPSGVYFIRVVAADNQVLHTTLVISR